VTAGQVWLTVLGGLIAGVIGLILFFVQRRFEHRDARAREEAAALQEFAEALMPLLIELDRWRYDPSQSTVWVGGSRQLPKLETWIFDQEENARKAPDWAEIGRLSQAVERLWRDRLSRQVSGGNVDRRWSEVSNLLFHLTRADGANARAAAEEAEGQVLDLLEEIRSRTA
jgi:hypothetical protein